MSPQPRAPGASPMPLSGPQALPEAISRIEELTRRVAQLEGRALPVGSERTKVIADLRQTRPDRIDVYTREQVVHNGAVRWTPPVPAGTLDVGTGDGTGGGTTVITTILFPLHGHGSYSDGGHLQGFSGGL